MDEESDFNVCLYVYLVLVLVFFDYMEQMFLVSVEVVVIRQVIDVEWVVLLLFVLCKSSVDFFYMDWLFVFW